MRRDFSRDSCVAFSHYEVGKCCNLINYSFFGDFKLKSKEVVISSEVANSSHAGPSNGCSALSSAECSSTGVSDDNSDIFSAYFFNLPAEFCGIFHWVWRQDDDVFSFNIAVVNTGSNSYMPAGYFG